MSPAPDFDWQVVLHSYRSVNSGDWDEVKALYDPGVQWRNPPGIPGRSVYLGPEGVKKAWERFTEVWGEWRIEPVESRDLGDRLLVRVRFSSRTLGTGIEGSTEFFQVWTAREGLVVRQETFIDEEQALKVAGVKL